MRRVVSVGGVSCILLGRRVGSGARLAPRLIRHNSTKSHAGPSRTDCARCAPSWGASAVNLNQRRAFITILEAFVMVGPFG